MLAASTCGEGLSLLLWVVAVVLALVGIVRLVGGDLLVGLGCIIAAFLVGPGGVSLFC